MYLKNLHNTQDSGWNTRGLTHLHSRTPRINLVQVDEGPELLRKVFHVVGDRDAAGRREDGQLHEVRPRHRLAVPSGGVGLEDFRHGNLHPTLAEEESFIVTFTLGN